MRHTFVRAMVINALVQFVITRHRAGHAIEEGAAEVMWMRYPFAVMVNALVWTLMLAMLRGGFRMLRGAR